MTSSVTPRQPRRPLSWPDVVLDLPEFLSDSDEVYIVGGAVRDAYLQRPIKDIDLVTANGAIRLARRLANQLNGDVFVLDAERDVARVLLDTAAGKLNIDVAGLRANDLLSDLHDRDFTLNAMAVDLRDGLDLLIDPLNGERDIIDKVIRRCAPQAVASDPIRALRAVRQSVQLGYRIEPETLKDVRTQAGNLYSSTSPERVRDEFFKLLNGAKAASALRIADTLGLLVEILPETSTLKADGLWEQTLTRVDKLTHVISTIGPERTDETAATFEMGMIVMGLDRFRPQLRTHIEHIWPNERVHSGLLILAAVLLKISPMTSAMIGDYAEHLRLSNGEYKRLSLILRDSAPASTLLAQPSIPPLFAYRFWRPLGVAGVDVILMILADYLAGDNFHQDTWLALIERTAALLEAYYLRHDEIVAPPVLVDGNDLQANLGIQPGPQIGMLLEAIREAQVTGEVRTADDALRLARSQIKG